MATEPRVLPAIAIPGLTPETLGNYLASLGLLRVSAQEWQNVRAAWNGGVFHLLGGPASLDRLLDHLCAVADQKAWTPYTYGWADAQKKSTKSGSARTLALWIALADEDEIEMFSSHAVPVKKVSFNPLLGTGGNSGKRKFPDGWKRAVEALVSSKKPMPDKRNELKALLTGGTLTWLLEGLNAASWFSDANKIYNSGQDPFREGGISPWAMVLACDGLPFFAGAASRRLGARARAVGAFPFVTYAAAPQSAGEAGRDLGEVWAPLWERPMTARETAILFSRGRAEVRGRGVLTPGGFAAAILQRGVDAGISDFHRFALGRTTSSNTFEPRFQGSLRVATEGTISDHLIAISTGVQQIHSLVERHLPRDEKKGDRWRFVGLRGPVEHALVRVAASPGDAETASSLLDAVVAALDRVDRNGSFRDKKISWEPLPLDWITILLRDPSPPETGLALACVSSFPAEQPFATYRFGVEQKGRRFVHVKAAPPRWVWRAGRLSDVLADVLARRILDWEKASHENANWSPVRLQVAVSAADVERWLTADVDEDLLSKWISRLALFDWRFASAGLRRSLTSRIPLHGVNGAMALFGIFQPLLDLRPLRLNSPGENLLPREAGARTPGASREIVNLIRAGRIDAAVRAATARYAMARLPLIRTIVPWSISDHDRLLASLLFTVFDTDRAYLVRRWMRPRRREVRQL